VCVTDLDKLNFVKLGFAQWFAFRLQSILETIPAASKYGTHFKSGQKRQKIITLLCLNPWHTLFVNGEPTLLVHCLYQMSPLNHKRATSSLAPPIICVAKKCVIKI